MIKRITILGVLMILISTPFLCLAQDSTYFKLGEKYYLKAEAIYIENIDSALYYVGLSAENFKKGEFWEEYVSILNAYQSLYDLSKNYAKVSESLAFTMGEAEKYLDKDNLGFAVTLSNYSADLADQGDYATAIKNFRRVLEIERNHEEHELVATSLKLIGSTYYNLGDLDRALQYYEECFNYDKVHPESLKAGNRSDIYRIRGLLYLEKGELVKAESDLSNSISLLPKTKKKAAVINNMLTMRTYYGFAEIQLQKNNLDRLKFYITKAINAGGKDFKNEKDIGEILLGKYHFKNGNFNKAKNHFLTAQQYNNKKLEVFKKHLDFSEINVLLGESYAKLNEFSNAIDHFKKALVNLADKEQTEVSKLQINPEDLINPKMALKAFKGIGLASFEQFKQSGNTDALSNSVENLKIASSLISKVRISYEEDNSLLRLSEEVLPIYESAIIANIEMYNQNGDIKYLKQAFEYNERSKSILLVESINKTTAIEVSGIPDSLLQKEKALNLQVTALKKKLYEENNKIDGRNEIIASKLAQQLFKDTEAYDELIRKFETSYSKYYNLKYNNTVATVDEIQEKLEGTKCQIIEYFLGENDTYVFSISEDKFELQSIPKSETFEANINQVISFLKTPPNGMNVNDELKQYLSLTKSFYDEYVSKSIFPDSKHLIFITDGPMGYLPFEALITKSPETNNTSFSLENLYYLFEDYEISYSYSSTLLLNSIENKTKQTRNTFFGVAPSFGIYNEEKTRICNDQALYSLQCSEDEVKQIKSKLGGKVLLGGNATLINTKDHLSDAKIIHFATHACLDDTNPEFNKIYLADDYLSNNDLYSLKLHSELAVLSACETGSGKLAKGEGVMSLARGFIHAGCPSIVMSLWSIDDCATSKIMVNFYDELSKGKTKPEALKQAKIKYIKNAKKANQHPYFWASFVQIGNFTPVDIPSRFPYLIFLGAFIFISLFAFLYFKKSRSR